MKVVILNPATSATQCNAPLLAYCQPPSQSASGDPLPELIVVDNRTGEILLEDYSP